MNDTQDKQYIALELTKIMYPSREMSKALSPSEDCVYDTYEKYLKRLTSTIDTIDTIDALKTEIERLQKENERLKTNNLDIIRPFANDIMNVLNGAKGDMEPYVYGSLVNIIKAKIQ